MSKRFRMSFDHGPVTKTICKFPKLRRQLEWYVKSDHIKQDLFGVYLNANGITGSSSEGILYIHPEHGEFNAPANNFYIELSYRYNDWMNWA